MAPTDDRLPAAVLWDLDGTIVDTEPLWIAAEHDLARRHGAQWSDEDALALVGSDLIDSGRYIKRRMGLAMSPEEIVATLVEVMSSAMTRDLVWRPGARELLAALGAAGVPRGLVTMSYREIADPLLERLPADTFDVVVTGDAVSAGKPHPEPYLAAARALGVDPGDCLAIEDSPTGTASAEAAGCHVLVVPHHVGVDGGPGRTVRTTLSGLGVDDLVRIAASPRSGVG